jgi:hypothetical protein
VIVGGPSPLDYIADPDANRRGNESGTALSNGHVRRRRGSEDWEEDGGKGEQSDMHLGGVFKENFRAAG